LNEGGGLSIVCKEELTGAMGGIAKVIRALGHKNHALLKRTREPEGRHFAKSRCAGPGGEAICMEKGGRRDRRGGS